MLKKNGSGQAILDGWKESGNNIYFLGTTREEKDSRNNLNALLQAGARADLIMSARILSVGGLYHALTEGVLHSGIGARVWVNEVTLRDGVDVLTALFAESEGRALVSVARENDVRFVGLCEGRKYPVLRIGVTDAYDAALEIQDVLAVGVAQLREMGASAYSALLRESRGE